MPQSDSPSFIHELRMELSPRQLSVLETRLNVARQVYNACLGEGLKRLKLMRESKNWQYACKMPKKIKDDKGRDINNRRVKNCLNVHVKHTGLVNMHYMTTQSI